MAKKSSGRVRVFFAEFEGDDDTVQSGIKAMAAAVNKTFESRKVIVARESPLTLEAPEEELEDEFEDVLDGEFVDSASNGSAKKKRTRKPPSMSVVKDLNLRPDGKKSLRDFFAEKNQLNNGRKLLFLFTTYKRFLK